MLTCAGMIGTEMAEIPELGSWVRPTQGPVRDAAHLSQSPGEVSGLRIRHTATQIRFTLPGLQLCGREWNLKCPLRIFQLCNLPLELAETEEPSITGERNKQWFARFSLAILGRPGA
jgi:hypothetical protein